MEGHGNRWMKDLCNAVKEIEEVGREKRKIEERCKGKLAQRVKERKGGRNYGKRVWRKEKKGSR